VPDSGLPLPFRIALLWAYIIQAMLNIDERLALWSARVLRMFTSQAIEALTMLLGAGWVICLVKEPRFLQMSPYLLPMETLVGANKLILISSFLAFSNGLCLYLARNDEVEKPDPSANTWAVHIVRSANFVLSGNAWLMSGLIVNAGVYAQAKTFSPFALIYFLMSFLCYAFFTRHAVQFRNYREKLRLKKLALN